jgi:predicted Zn-ribbon and HTH transcriptional regulator
MITYLKPREYYEDIYDRGTVEQCRFLHHHKLKVTDKDIEEAKLTPQENVKIQEVKGLWIDVVQEMAAFFAAAERFNKKDSAIEKMMADDSTKDHILTNAQLPSNARCRKCMSRDLRTVSKDLWHDSEGKDNRVLFMFSCNDCQTKTAFYDDGEEWIVEPTRCPVCNSERLTHTKTNENDILTLKYTCGRCDNVWEEVHDYSYKPKKEKPDPNYHEDRKLYCYSKKVRGWAEDLKNNPISYKTRPSWEENETEKLYKAELAKIEILTITQVNKRISALLKKNGYKDFELGKPNMDKELVVHFTVIDEKDGRSGEDSRNTVWRLLSKVLDATNWRLIRSSLNYRVGYINGKIRAYENKLELEKLIDQKLKKSKQVIQSK